MALIRLEWRRQARPPVFKISEKSHLSLPLSRIRPIPSARPRSRPRSIRQRYPPTPPVVAGSTAALLSSSPALRVFICGRRRSVGVSSDGASGARVSPLHAQDRRDLGSRFQVCPPPLEFTVPGRCGLGLA